jgi:hypothetical protein
MRLGLCGQALLGTTNTDGDYARTARSSIAPLYVQVEEDAMIGAAHDRTEAKVEGSRERRTFYFTSEEIYWRLGAGDGIEVAGGGTRS